MNDFHGFGGADSNVQPLFADRPTAAGLPPQPEVIANLERLLDEARAGQIVGFVVATFDSQVRHREGTVGRVPFEAMMAALATLQFRVLFQDFMRSHGEALPK